jgi:class 3 adenylate cyclase
MEPPASAIPLNSGGESSLAAIIFTDVEGYTPKMAADQNRTLALVHRDLQIMTPLCQQHQGRVVEDTGDGLFMCFFSAVNAVACAQAIQKALFQAATELPPDEVLQHRIGIYLGDVAHFDSGKVKGHGVNMAARLQTAAKPGGICISQTVYDVVKNRLPLPRIYQEVRIVKGITEPMTLYQIPPLNTQTEICRRVFISYRSQNPDLSLAEQFKEALETAGHEAFMAGHDIRLGEGWPQRIEAELQQSDYLLLLLSKQSVTSEMVTEEVRRAKELRDNSSEGKPVILPIRVDFPFNVPLNYNLRGYLDRIEQREWRSPADTPAIIQEVLDLIAEGRIPEAAPDSLPSTPPALEGPDGKPLPAAVPELPEGQVSLTSVLYVERPPIESRCYQRILQPGALIRIKAPRQMGKTSLMARILHHASMHGCQTVSLSFQLAERKIFTDLDKFLQWFCANVTRRLRLENRLSDYWDDIFGSKDNCSVYFEEYLLENLTSPLVLGLDEVDCVFQYPEIATEFFGLLRAWHEDAKNREQWKKLRLIVVHSTEIYLPLSINQSPFNVGLPIDLPEFTPEQVQDLAQRHDLTWNVEPVEQLMAMVGGHPYLVRLTLYHIRYRGMTMEQVLQQAATEAGLYGDHLRRHLWNLQQDPDLAAAMKQVVCATEPVRLESMQEFKLHSMGLVHLQGNKVIPRCNLYRLYFSDRLEN